MTSDDDLKFDIRVRERLLEGGTLTEAEVARHLEGLRDAEADAVPVVVRQPALQSESDRDIVIVRTSGVRPPPTPPRLDDDLDGIPIDDEDDDLDDEDDEEKDEDEDEKDEDEDESKEEKPAAAAPKPAAADEADSSPDESEKSEAAVDDDWGNEP